MGATVGSVIATRGAIVPSAVGVDIGCGMEAVRTTLRAADLPDSLGAVRSAVEEAVPHGRTSHGGPGDRGAWGEPPAAVRELCLDEKDRVWVMLHSGSRGIGNRIGSYFIERAKAEMERWFVLRAVMTVKG